MCRNWIEIRNMHKLERKNQTVKRKKRRKQKSEIGNLQKLEIKNQKVKRREENAEIEKQKWDNKLERNIKKLQSRNS